MSAAESFHPADVQELSPEDQTFMELLKSGRLAEFSDEELTGRRDELEDLFRTPRPPYAVPQG